MSCKRPHLPTLKCQPGCAKKKTGRSSNSIYIFYYGVHSLNPIFNDICKHVTVIDKEGEWVLGINT